MWFSKSGLWYKGSQWYLGRSARGACIHKLDRYSAGAYMVIWTLERNRILCMCIEACILGFSKGSASVCACFRGTRTHIYVYVCIYICMYNWNGNTGRRNFRNALSGIVNDAALINPNYTVMQISTMEQKSLKHYKSNFCTGEKYRLMSNVSLGIHKRKCRKKYIPYITQKE